MGRLLAPAEPTAAVPDGFERLPSLTERDELEFARQFSETVEDAENRQRLRCCTFHTRCAGAI